jgi:hypothetical protein
LENNSLTERQDPRSDTETSQKIARLLLEYHPRNDSQAGDNEMLRSFGKRKGCSLKNYASLSLASLSVLLLFCSNVNSQPTDDLAQSGNAFVRVCSVIDKDPKEHNALEVAQDVACVKYVEGLVQGVYEEISYSHAVTDKEPPKPFCLPGDVEDAQTVRIVLKYVHDHPDKAHMATSTLILLALAWSFPCQTK